MESAVPVVLNAASYVSILLLIALGLAIVFGMMDIVNLAHGEFVTIGAYTLSYAERMGGGEAWPAGYWIGLVTAPVVGAAFGFVVEIAVIRPLRHRPLDALLATFALSLILQKLISIGFGAQPQIVFAPIGGVISILGAHYPSYRLFMIAVSIALTSGCLLLFARTRFGTDLRAVIQDVAMAEALGINSKRLGRIAFTGGAALAAFAGALVAPLASVEAHLGLFYLGKAFFVIVLGGIGSILGCVVGAAAVGTSETLLNYLFDPSFASAAVLTLAIVVIRLRPRGLVPGFSAAHHLFGKE